MAIQRPFDVSFKLSVPTGFGVIWVAEFSGFCTALDKLTTNNALASTAASTGATGVLSQANEVIVSFLSHATPQLATNTGGFSTLIDRDNGAGELNDGELRYNIAVATTTRNDTWTVTSEEWAAIIASFRCSAGALFEQQGHSDMNSAPDGKARLATIPKRHSMLVVCVTAGSGLPVGFCKPVDSYGSVYIPISEFVTTSLYLGMWATFDFAPDGPDFLDHPNHTVAERTAERARVGSKV